MTKEITLKEAVSEINRLNRERDALKQQVAEAEQFTSDIANALEIPHEPPVSKGECGYLAAINALKDDIKELVFCECCGQDCEKIPENATHPPRYCHDCYLNLRAEIADLKAQLARAAIGEGAVGESVNAELQSVDTHWLLATKLQRSEVEVAQLREALEAYPEWTPELDEDGCPTEWVGCIICGGTGSTDGRRKLPPTHKSDCQRQAALNGGKEGGE